MADRDDFTQYQKETLAEKTDYRCCRCGKDAKSDGQAAHITAASEDGPRYDKNMTSKQRKDISNGIWLCPNCHAKVDGSKASKFTTEYLQDLKTKHEQH